MVDIFPRDNYSDTNCCVALRPVVLVGVVVGGVVGNSLHHGFDTYNRSSVAQTCWQPFKNEHAHSGFCSV